MCVHVQCVYTRVPQSVECGPRTGGSVALCSHLVGALVLHCWTPAQGDRHVYMHIVMHVIGCSDVL